MEWTKNRLEEMVYERLGETQLVVVANREPYVHVYEDNEIRCVRPAGGLATALDPVMRTCGGVWVAHGAGDADRETVDAFDRVLVPPEDPSYTLRRVWLGKKEEQGYYYGFSNEGLWPLCHVAYTRPQFDATDWRYYRSVNLKFAEAVLDEVGDRPALIFVQDYHLALLPRMLKNVRDDLVVAQFWHIPWPNPEVFRVCPWKKEILDGMLGNDLLAFHIQRHCNNFLDTVGDELEARIDREHFAVTCGGRTTRVRACPISIDPEAVQSCLPMARASAERILRRRLGAQDEKIMLGVDRIDYTKGIPERFAAVERLLQLHPELKGTFRLVQIGSPSRDSLPAYRQLSQRLVALADEINWRYGQDGWRPIQLINEHCSSERVIRHYRIADVCVVSSLHDGMNLVAKEYVAARDGGEGVLVLSQFTGAARELTDAVQINPYAIDEFAEALYTALTMPPEEQRRRMARMRRQVAENNIYRWAGTLLDEASRLAEERQEVEEFV